MTSPGLFDASGSLAVALPLVAVLLVSAAAAVRARATVRRLERLVRIDELTGVLNRRGWNDALPRELARAHRSGRPVVVGLLDLDGFKARNDRHGHLAGDAALRSVGEAARQAIRADDTVARVGGDEFGLILPDCSLDQAAAVVNRLRDGIVDGQRASVGLVLWNSRESADELFRRADDLLYEAKLAGGNRTLVGSPGVRARVDATPQPERFPRHPSLRRSHV